MKETLVSVTCAAALVCLAGCHKAAEKQPAAAPPPVPVTVAVAQKVDAPIVLRAIGTVESKARVMLRPQVTARVRDIPVSEGSDVQAGQEVIRLDAGPFEASLRQAQAELERAKAVADDAHSLVQRLGDAAVASAVSKRDLEDAQAKARGAEADIAAAEAHVDAARWDVSYCTIAAPFAGRLGAVMVKPGDILKANEADLVELAQIDPIEVGFAVPEDNIPAIREAMNKGPVSVEVLPSGETAAPVTGTLTFVDSKVDPATGTIRLKATFGNADRRLWPGRFSRVTVLLGHEPDSVSVPEGAVQASQAGPTVFVIGADQVAQLREVKVRRIVDGQGILDSGVAAGESVVTEGQLRLAPASKVQVKNGAPSTAQPGK